MVLRLYNKLESGIPHNTNPAEIAHLQEWGCPPTYDMLNNIDQMEGMANKFCYIHCTKGSRYNGFLRLEVGIC